MSPGARTAAAVVLGWLTLLAVVPIVWLRPQHSGDTFMVLAGGRDVADGKLGARDDWAFTTDRPWINQNWGTGLLFYEVQAAVGLNGLVAIKAILVAVIALALFLAMRRGAVGTPVAALVTAATLLAARSYLDMRANMVSLALVASLQWTLYAARDRPRRVWIASLLIGVWANMHGSFLFGIGMLGLWTLCTYAALLGSGAVAERRRHLHLPAAVAAATVLSVVTSPFGVQNLTFPLTSLTGAGAVWRDVAEWQPILGGTSEFASAREFLLLVGVLVGAAVASIAARRSAPAPRDVAARLATATVLFQVALALLAIWMAFASRRFVPVALLVGAPLLARLLSRLLADRRLAWPTAVAASIAVAVTMLTALDPLLAAALGALLLGLPGLLLRRRAPETAADPLASAALLAVVLAAAVTQVPVLRHHYDPDNPLFRPYARLFERMIYYDGFPIEAAQYLNANGVRGRVYNEWWWEGYLHWFCPDLELFVGGRAQTAYPPELYTRWLALSTGNVPPRLAAEQGVPLIVVPAYREPLTNRLYREPESPWVAIFCNGWEWVFANATTPYGQELIRRTAAGEMTYPAPAAARISRVAFLCSPATNAGWEDVLSAARAANLERPSPIVYSSLMHRAGSDAGRIAQTVAYLEAEAARLQQIDHHRPKGEDLLLSRKYIADLLVQYYWNAKQPQRASAWQLSGQQAQAAFDAERARTGLVR